MNEQKEKQQQWQKGSMSTVQALQMSMWGGCTDRSLALQSTLLPLQATETLPLHAVILSLLHLSWHCHFADPTERAGPAPFPVGNFRRGSG